MIRVLLLSLALTACHSGRVTQPVAGAGPLAPLPPSSGTPVGVLIDESTRLSLRSEQIDKLRALDESLIAHQDQLDSLDRTSQPGPGGAPPPRRTKSHAAMSLGGGGQVGGKHHRPVAGDAAKIAEQRRANQREAIVHALEVLDPAQRDPAIKLLNEHGFSLDPKPPVGSTEEETEPDSATDFDQ